MKVLQPIIFLLNKLRYSVKFLIVGCVLLIPLFAICTVFLSAKVDEMRQINKKLEGADYSILLKDLLQYTQQARTLQFTNLEGIGTNQASLDELSLKLNESFEKLEKMEKDLKYDYKTKEQLQEIRELWETLQTTTWTNSDQVLTEYTYVIDKILFLMTDVVNNSDLLLVDSKETYNLVFNATIELPKLMEKYSYLEALGISHINGTLSSEQLKKFDEIYYPMQTSISDMLNRMNVVYNDPYFQSKLEEPLKSLQDNTAKYLSELSVIKAQKLNMKEFEHAAVNAINDNYDFYEASIQIMESKLKNEYEQLKKTNIFNFTALIITCIIALLIFISLYFAIHQSITKLAEGSRQIAKGNLDVEISLKTKDEMKKVESSFNEMAKQLNDLVHEISISAEHVAASSQQLSASTEEANASIEHVTSAVSQISSETEIQSESLHESAQAMNEMVTGIERIAENSVKISSLTNEATQFADEGNKTVGKAIEQMELINETVGKTSEKINELYKHSEEIGSIINVISDIAEQTNLLALNAAIEAARAGEHGKGFAVVADAVRKLAEQSKQSTNKIAEIIQTVQKDTTNSVEMMELVNKNVQAGIDITKETAYKFSHILTSMQTLNPQMEDISATTAEFSAQVEQVATAIQNLLEIVKQTSEQTLEISSSAQEQSAAMAEISSSAVSLSEMAESLQNLVSNFQVKKA